MKPNIHPEYVESQIVCACGTVYHTRSTKQNIRLGICAACHPFFTGQQKFVVTDGRVEKITRRFGPHVAAKRKWLSSQGRSLPQNGTCALFVFIADPAMALTPHLERFARRFA